MTDELFFLPLIARALPGSDPAPALANAFARIRSTEGNPEGCRQFVQFMRAVNEHVERRGLDLAVRRAARQETMEIVVERDDEQIAVLRMEGALRRRSVAGIVPGLYTLTLETGRVLWQGALSKTDLLWREAKPGEPLELAADTGGPGAEPTKQVELYEAGLTLSVFPGVEAGHLEIERRR